MKGSTKRLMLLLITSLTTIGAFSQEVIEVNDTTQERILYLNELTYYIDFSNNLTVKNVSEKEFSKNFHQHDSYQNKDYQTNASYWIKIPIHNTHQTQKV